MVWCMESLNSLLLKARLNLQLKFFTTWVSLNLIAMCIFCCRMNAWEWIFKAIPHYPAISLDAPVFWSKNLGLVHLTVCMYVHVHVCVANEYS